MPAVAEAPPAPAASPTIVPAKPVNIPAAKGEIHVAPPVEAPPAPKPGSARERMMQDLQKRAKPTNAPADEPTPPPVTTTAKKAEAPAPTTPETPEPGEEVEAAPEAAAPKPGEATVEKPAEKGKDHPWKLLKQEEKRSAALKQELEDLRKLVTNETERKSEIERLSKAEARAKELEDHIRFVDYSKSEEFKTKYQQPYEKAWSRAMSELKEITVQGTDGNARAVQVQDMLELVNLPLGKARELANEAFGDFADDVMAHRKEIRNLFDQQQAALDEARTNGAEREKLTAAERTKQQQEMVDFTKKHWASANESILKDEKYGKHFVPIEGDEQGNQRLAKGFELADRAFSENPMDPSLTTEQRASIIKRHAAVRNRCAAFGRMNYQLEQAAAKITELETKLKQFEGTVPETKGSEQAAETTPAFSTARNTVFSALRKIAK